MGVRTDGQNAVRATEDIVMKQYEEHDGIRTYFATDRDIFNMTHGFDLNEVCRYHREKGGVVCDQKKRTDAMCSGCGWNPRVSRMRIRKFLEGKEKNEQSDVI